MRVLLIGCLLLSLGRHSAAQKIRHFDFNLYTDSLKRGFFNYINIDAQMADGSWRPLDSSTLILTANTGFFEGNDLFIDSSYTGDSVVVRAILRDDQKRWKQAVIYIRKRPFAPLPEERGALKETHARRRQGTKKESPGDVAGLSKK